MSSGSPHNSVVECWIAAFVATIHKSVVRISVGAYPFCILHQDFLFSLCAICVTGMCDPV